MAKKEKNYILFSPLGRYRSRYEDVMMVHVCILSGIIGQKLCICILQRTWLKKNGNDQRYTRAIRKFDGCIANRIYVYRY